MSKIHAFNRTKLYTHTFPDVTLVFELNEHGHAVCDVQSESAVERLLCTPSAFRTYSRIDDRVEDASVVPPIVMPVFEAEAISQAVLGAQAPAETLVESGSSSTSDPMADFILRGPEGATLDLTTLDDASLREFALANKITVHHAAKGDTIRRAIVKALTATAA